MNDAILTNEERVVLSLRDLYRRFGYLPYGRAPPKKKRDRSAARGRYEKPRERFVQRYAYVR